MLLNVFRKDILYLFNVPKIALTAGYKILIRVNKGISERVLIGVRQGIQILIWYTDKD